jgi:hypothetical protein
MTQKSNKNNSVKQTCSSIAAALLGVQSQKNHQRDFSQGKASHFIIGAVIALVLFITVLLGLTKMMMPA